MKKLFRFKYEPCNGTCYAWGDDFYEGLRSLSLKERTELVELVVRAHDKLCDNPEYYFGLDKCEKTGLFIGHFHQSSRIDFFIDVSLSTIIHELCEFVVKTDIPVLEGNCVFDDNGSENLAEKILSVVGL